MVPSNEAAQPFSNIQPPSQKAIYYISFSHHQFADAHELIVKLIAHCIDLTFQCSGILAVSVKKKGKVITPDALFPSEFRTMLKPRPIYLRQILDLA